MNSTVRNILVNIVVAAVTGSVVFAATMTSVVKQVNVDGVEIAHLKEADAQIRQQIGELSRLVTVIIDQNKELVAIMKLQNRSLQ